MRFKFAALNMDNQVAICRRYVQFVRAIGRDNDVVGYVSGHKRHCVGLLLCILKITAALRDYS